MSSIDGNGLRAVLEANSDGRRGWLDRLTVLAPQNDPFRADTESGHRDGEWLAERLARLGRAEPIHLRGLHYVVLGEIKPDGTPYTNTEENWIWLQGKAAKAARWLGYVGFEQIVDQRNSPPVVRLFEPPAPSAAVSVGELEITVPERLTPAVQLDDFRGVQPYKLVIFGEKVSLDAVLSPIAEQRAADLYLPTGEASDSMIHQMASVGAEDGRRMIVFYLSDCDPAGWQMAISVSRKLQALKALEFTGLEFEVRPIALTPDQVREHGLPSTPLKASEKRAGRWLDAMGVEQTEIDALATLQPELLRRIVLRATLPFFDPGLDDRVREVRRTWEAEAQEMLVERIGDEQLERLRIDATAKLAELEDEVRAINDALTLDLDGSDLELPALPEIPEADAHGGNGLPLIDSDWSFVEQTERLIAWKRYGG